MKKILLALLLIFILPVVCTMIYERVMISRVKPGMTRTEVIEAIGEPQNVNPQVDPPQAWVLHGKAVCSYSFTPAQGCDAALATGATEFLVWHLTFLDLDTKFLVGFNTDDQVVYSSRAYSF